MKTITVKGTGAVSLPPDIAVIDMTLNSTDMEYERAMEKASGAIDRLTAGLAAAGFPEKDLKTSGFRVNTRYESYQDEKGGYRSRFAGYECVHQLTVELPFTPERLGEALGAVTGSTSEPELNIRFSVRDKEGAKDRLLKNAAADARHKAELLCEAAGARLGELQSISYSFDEVRLYSDTDYRVGAKLMAAESVAITPEDINISDTASFVWELL